MSHRCTLIILALAAAAAGSGATYEVGPGKAYATLAGLPALSPGDTVEISGGPYHEVKRWTDSGTSSAPIVVRGVGTSRPVIDADGIDVSGSLPHPRAVLQVEGSWITIEHLELENARNGDNGSGVRICTFGADTDHVTIRDCRIHDCDMGIMNGQTDHTLIEACEVDHNGTSAYAGYSHNFYLGGGASTVRGCYIHDALYGQNVKSRGHYTELLYNVIADSQDGEVGLVDEAETVPADSNAVLIGNVIVSKPRGSGWNSTRFIMFGSDLGGAHTGTMYVYNNTCVAGTTSINFLWSDRAESAIVAKGNVFVGSATVTSGSSGPVTGDRNWMPSGASAPGFTGSVTGSAPGFVDGGGRDFHLTAGSPCRGIALTGWTFLDGAGASHAGTPTLQYEGLGSLIARPSDGALDAGAYEYASAGTTATGGTTTGGTTASSGGTTTTSTGTSAGGTTGAPVGGGGGRGKCGLGGALGLALALGLLLAVRRSDLGG